MEGSGDYTSLPGFAIGTMDKAIREGITSISMYMGRGVFLKWKRREFC